ncbi:236815cf-07cf-42f9-b11b-36ff7aa02bfe [Sclerotinia trifoliorum]|uniref:236815cf-07cf-42f9-b11b-36ff7aa02bfe n=1 Tax=Sclerotinia trifoliorum TaxID=28548 RepID=A0A8H2ZR67_9HELO|nr:236815cf-07cf-42f9-b11b-36ff7aa02bfe [Sclerotinia trifoliorum]
MQEFVNLISSSPEPELPKARTKAAPIVTSRVHLKDTSPNIPRPPTVQLFDYSFANFDNSIGTGTVKAPTPPDPSTKAKPSKTIQLDDGNSIQLWSDDFDTTLGSVVNSTSAKQNTGFSKQYKRDNAPIEITDSDDPFTSPPPAKRRKASLLKEKVPRAAGGYKRTVSNIESVQTSKARSSKYSLNRSKSMGADPLLFTSSPDVSDVRSRHGKGKGLCGPYDDDEDGVEIPRKKANKPDHLELEDSDEFPSIENLKSWNPPPKDAKTSDDEPTAHYYDEDSAPEKKRRGKVDKSKDKALSATEKKAAKDAEKEQKRIDKEYAKAEKEREKERAKDLAKVNIDRTKPEISTPEMIVDLPSCIQDKSNMALRARINILLQELNVQQSQWENSELVIKWRRKVISEYNEESDIWEPKAQHIKNEKYTLCVLSAKKFVDMSLGEGYGFRDSCFYSQITLRILQCSISHRGTHSMAEYKSEH